MAWSEARAISGAVPGAVSGAVPGAVSGAVPGAVPGAVSGGCKLKVLKTSGFGFSFLPKALKPI